MLILNNSVRIISMVFNIKYMELKIFASQGVNNLNKDIDAYKNYFLYKTIKKFSRIEKTFYLCTRNEQMIASYWRNGRAVECGSLENC